MCAIHTHVSESWLLWSLPVAKHTFKQLILSWMQTWFTLRQWFGFTSVTRIYAGILYHRKKWVLQLTVLVQYIFCVLSLFELFSSSAWKAGVCMRVPAGNWFVCRTSADTHSIGCTLVADLFRSHWRSSSERSHHSIQIVGVDWHNHTCTHTHTQHRYIKNKGCNWDDVFVCFLSWCLEIGGICAERRLELQMTKEAKKLKQTWPNRDCVLWKSIEWENWKVLSTAWNYCHGGLLSCIYSGSWKNQLRRRVFYGWRIKIRLLGKNRACLCLKMGNSSASVSLSTNLHSHIVDA